MTHFEGPRGRGRARTKDSLVMFEVRYAGGRSSYIRVKPSAAEHGTLATLGIARARQATGEIPEGEIIGVQRVK